MRISKLSSLISLTTVLLLGPLTAAQAQKPGLYVGAAVGAYSIDESNLSDNDRVLKAYAGAQFTNWFGIEGSWTDFNRVDNVGDYFEADGVGAAAVLSLPMGSTSSLFIKGGQFWWKSDSVLGGTMGADDSGSDPFWGVGAKVGFNDHLAIRLEVERYDVADIKLYAFMGGLEFKF
jgi:OmpA-OmpF porin, OOP family